MRKNKKAIIYEEQLTREREREQEHEGIKKREENKTRNGVKNRKDEGARESRRKWVKVRKTERK